MAKSFEYRTLTMSWAPGESTEAMDAELNRLGKKGWELVGVDRRPPPAAPAGDDRAADERAGDVVLFVFKRAEK